MTQLFLCSRIMPIQYLWESSQYLFQRKGKITSIRIESFRVLFSFDDGVGDGKKDMVKMKVTVIKGEGFAYNGLIVEFQQYNRTYLDVRDLRRVHLITADVLTKVSALQMCSSSLSLFSSQSIKFLASSTVFSILHSKC